MNQKISTKQMEMTEQERELNKLATLIIKFNVELIIVGVHKKKDKKLYDILKKLANNIPSLDLEGGKSLMLDEEDHMKQREVEKKSKK